MQNGFIGALAHRTLPDPLDHAFGIAAYHGRRWPAA